MSRGTTIGEVAEWWLHNVQKHQVRASTWAQTEDRVRKIVATTGNVQVGKLKVEHVITWQGQLLESPAPKTVGHHRQTLAQVLDQAVELGLVASNVVRRVKAPMVPPTNARSLSIAEARALVDAARSDRYGAVIALLFFQGWRVSEALGLAWEDLDLEQSTATASGPAPTRATKEVVSAPPRPMGSWVNTASYRQSTGGYVRDLGRRPTEFAHRAALLLDPAASD